MDAAVSSFSTESETEPPVIAGRVPRNGAIDVPVDEALTFLVQDTGEGVDTDTLQVWVPVKTYSHQIVDFSLLEVSPAPDTGN